MTTEHELPAELDNLIAGLRIENINLKLAVKKADALLREVASALPIPNEHLGLAGRIAAHIASQQGEPVMDIGIELSKEVSMRGRDAIVESQKPHILDFCPPKHPEQAEGAQGEREALPYWEPCNPGCDPEFNGERSRYCDQLCHNARTALAQPSPAPELERPVAVAYRSSESGNIYEQDYGLKNPEPLMEVAQHDRIVGALRAEREDARRTSKFWKSEHLAGNAALDAAQARVAELEKLSRAHDPLRIGLSAMLGSFKVAANAEQEGTLRMAQQLFDATADARYGDFKNKAVVDRLIAGLASPVSQAGQVPEGWKLVPTKPTIEMVEAGYEESFGKPDRSEHARVIEQYDAMLAAAPAQGGADPEEDWHRDMQLNDDRDRADYLDSLEDGGDE